MKLFNKMIPVLCCATLAAGAADSETAKYAGRQIELCMVGDSITWAGNGDFFRFYLLKHMPELAFVGTHTARLGYSHAGEGGNNTARVIARLKDIPDSRYYHLLLGVNDCAAAKSLDEGPPVARRTADALARIANELADRPGTEKLFLGSILPCCPDNDPDSDRFQFRDAAGSATNEILRERFREYFPSGKVVWVEYEKLVRPRDDWRKIIRLHPVPAGYEVIAGILADTLKKETAPPPAGAEKETAWGVEVVNLWQEDKNISEALIPGWYTVSFKVDSCTGDELKVRAKSVRENLKFPFDRTFTVSARPGSRAEFELYTGTEGYEYNFTEFALSAENGEISEILIEKMRPGKKASIYGTGSYIDGVSPASPGELLAPVK